MAKSSSGTKSPSKKWTVAQLRKYISTTTRKVNDRLRDRKKTNAYIEKEVKKLQKLGGKAVRKVDEVGVHLKGKNKDTLIRQARALAKFIDNDIFTPKGEIDADDKSYRAYKSFMESAKGVEGLTYDQWEQMVVDFANAGSTLFHQFDSSSVAELYKERVLKDDKQVDLINAMKKARKNVGKGATQKDLIDELRNVLGLSK